MLCLNNSNITIITVKEVDCGCIIYDTNKYDAINWLENFMLDDRGHMYNIYQRNQYQKYRVYNYYFDNLNKVNKLETKNILIIE